MAITNWPINERPREKLLTHGSSALSDAELLAIFLRTGTRGQSALDLARTLLNHFGSLRKLLNCSLEEFSQHKGLGAVKYAQLQAVLELGARFLGEKLTEQPILSCHETTQRYLTAKLRDLPHEVFYCLFLNSQNQLIACEPLAQGTHNSSRVYPREVIKRALHHNAAAVIFAHNHPSGNSEASRADITLTQVLQESLDTIDVEVHDHLIIGEGQTLSFKQRGWLA